MNERRAVPATPIRSRDANLRELPGDDREVGSGMDMPRGPRRWSQRNKRIVVITGAVLLAVAVTVVLANLEPAVPTVRADTLWIGTVERGEFVRQVRGPGTLAPMQRRWITADTSGRVEEILALPGAEVTADTPLLRLENPELTVQLLNAQQQLSDAEAALVTLRSQVESDRLAQQALIANVRTQYLEAKHRDEINQELIEKTPGLVAEFDLARGKQIVEELANRLRIESRRYEVLGNSSTEQIAALKEQADRLRAIVRFNEDRVASLDVTAGVAGVLAELPMEAGQWVRAGDTLGRVVEPGRLKAEIRIPQSQAEDIVVGQQAIVDTRGDVIDGEVSRIDPTVRAGTVTIDVALPSELPRSVRPDMSVDGTVVLDRTADVTKMGRPAQATAHATVGIYRLTGDVAERVQVELGRISVNEVEVVRGLTVGDEVVLSDMTQWQDDARVRVVGR
ncbi:MAG: HlyD family efflux transporter periplasmic adaptor subunit [Gammaproteobacteria bacterium]|nr:HlyD family efflux transporter periplasmic adaptor subunit [Gammaproteobacteria bacterium]